MLAIKVVVCQNFVRVKIELTIFIAKLKLCALECTPVMKIKKFCLLEWPDKHLN